LTSSGNRVPCYLVTVVAVAGSATAFMRDLFRRQVEDESDLDALQRIGSRKYLPERVNLPQERVPGRPVPDRVARFGQGAKLLNGATVTHDP
jgi:hypothetical protein